MADGNDPVDCRTAFNNAMTAAYNKLNAVLANPNSTHGDISEAYSVFEAESAAAWAAYNACVNGGSGQ